MRGCQSLAASLRAGKSVSVADLIGRAWIVPGGDGYLVRFEAKRGPGRMRRLGSAQAAVIWALRLVRGQPVA